MLSRLGKRSDLRETDEVNNDGIHLLFGVRSADMEGNDREVRKTCSRSDINHTSHHVASRNIVR